MNLSFASITVSQNPTGYRHRFHDAFATYFQNLSHNYMFPNRVFSTNRVARIFQETSDLNMEWSRTQTNQKSNAKHSMNPLVRRSLVIGDLQSLKAKTTYLKLKSPVSSEALRKITRSTRTLLKYPWKRQIILKHEHTEFRKITLI